MQSKLRRSLFVLLNILILFCPTLRPGIAQETAPPIRYLEGHKGAIYAVAASPDGQSILSAGIDGNIRIWDRETGALIRAIPAHAGTVLSLAVAPDGRRFVSGGVHGGVNLFDLPRQNPLTSITNVPGLAATLAVSPNGSLVATGDNSPILRLWNTANNQHLRDFAGVTAPITAAEFLDNAQFIVAASSDGTIRGWNVGDGAALGLIQTSPISNMAVYSSDRPDAGHLLGIAGTDGTLRLLRWPPMPPENLPGHSDQVTAVVLSHDGKLVATGGIDQLVNLDDAATGKPIRALAGQPGKVASIAFSPDDSLLASGSDIGTLKFWKTGDGADQRTILGHVGAINAVAFHPSVNRVASAGADGTVRIWRLPKAPQVLAGHTMPVADISLTADGEVAASAGSDKSIRMWTLSDGKQKKVIANQPQPLTKTELSQDGRLLAVGDTLGDLRIWDLTGDAGPHSLGAHAGGVSGLSFGKDDKLLYSSGLDGTVKSWNLPINPPKSLPPSGAAVHAVVLSQDEKLIVSAATDGTLRIVERGTGKLIKQVKVSATAITALTVSADNAIIAASDSGGVVTLLNAADGSIRSRIAGHVGAVQAIRFHPRLADFLTAGTDGTIRRWQAPEPSPVLRGHTKPVGSLSVNADGTQILSTSADGTARFWTSNDGKPVTTLQKGKIAINSSAWRADGKQVATGDAAGTIRLLNPTDGTVTATLAGHKGAVAELAYRTQNDMLASAGADGLLRVWKLPVGPSQQLAKYNSAVKTIAVSHDGALAIVGDGAKTLHTIDLVANKATATVKDLAGIPTSVAIAADKSFIAAATDVGTVDVYAAAGTRQFRVVGHPGGATGVAFHPQTKQVASVGGDGTLRIWDFAAVPKLLAGHTKPVTAFAVSPKGTQLATGSADNSVRLWNLTNGAAVRTFAGHTGAITGLAWTADETRVVSSSTDKTARLWNVADGKQLALFTGHTAAVNDVTITPDGSKVITASTDKLVKIWNVAEVIKAGTEKSGGEGNNVTPARNLAGHTKSAVSVVLLANGATVAAGGADGSVRIWNIADGKATANIATGAGVRDIAVSPDGKLLAVAGQDKLVRLYNPVDGKALATINGHSQPVATVNFSRDSTRLLATATDGIVGVWEATGRLLELRKPAGVQTGAACFGADSQTLLLAGSDNSIRMLPLALTRLIVASEMPLSGVAWTPDGSGLVTGGMDKTVKLWNATNGQVVRSYPGNTDAVTGVAFSRDGTHVVAASADKTARLWTTANAAVVATLTHPAAVHSAMFNADGSRIVTAAGDASVRVWDVSTKQVLQRFDEHSKLVRSVHFAADGRSILSGGDDMTLRRSPIAATAVVAAHPGGAQGVAFLPKGDGLISSGADKRVAQFDLTGKLVREYVGCTQAATAVVVRSDGLQVAAICADKHLYQWQLANGQMLRKTPVTADLTAIAYTADGKRLLIGSTDKQVRAFDSETGQVFERFEVPAAVTSLATLPDNLTVAIGLANNSTMVRRLAFRTLFAGHTGAVNTVVWTADGKSLLSGGADKTIRHWNAETGAAIRTLNGHTDAVTSVAVTADSTQVISSSIDKTLRLWTLSNGAPLISIPVAAVVRRVALNGDSTRFATVGDDGVVRAWDRVAGRELQRFAGHTGVVRGVAISGDGNTILSGGDDKTVRVWPVAAVSVIVADSMKVHDLKVFPDGRQFATAGEDKIVKMWDAGGKLVRSFGGSAAAVAHVTVSDDGKQIAAGGDPLFAQKNLLVWNVADAKLLHNIATPAGITDVQFGSNGRIAVAGADKHLRVYSATDARLLQDTTVAATIADIEFVPGTTSIATASTDNKNYLLDYSLLKLLTGHEGAVTGLQYTSDGKQLLTAGADGTARLWNVADGEVVSTLTGSASAINRLVLSKDGKRVVAGRADKNVDIWDLPGQPASQLKPASTLVQAVPITALAVDKTGNRIAVGGNDNLIHIWDSKTGTEIERLAGHAGAIHSLAFADDAKTLYSGSVDKTARRWTPSIVDVVTAHEGALTDIRFSSNGETIYTAGGDKAVKSWSTIGLKPQHSFTGANVAVDSLALSPDDRLLAAVGDEPVVRIWATDGAAPIAVQKMPAPQATVLFAMEGRQLLVAGADKIVRNYGIVRKDGKLQLELTHEGIGHTEPITDLAVADDNHTLFSVGADKHVKRWYAATHTPIRRMTEQKGAIYSLAFSPDSTLFAAGGADKAVRVWESETGDLRHQLEGHTRAVSAVTFHARGKELASGSHDGTFRIYTLADIVPIDPMAGKPKEAAEAKSDENNDDKPAPPDRGPKPGLLAFTYVNNTFTGDPKYEVVSQIDLDWGKGSKSLSRVWVGTLTLPGVEEIRFSSLSNPQTNNSLRVFVGNQLVIDGLDPKTATDGRQGRVTIDEGSPRDVPIRIEYSQNGPSGALRLSWSWEGHESEVIPAAAFKHRSIYAGDLLQSVDTGDRLNTLTYSNDGTWLIPSGRSKTWNWWSRAHDRPYPATDAGRGHNQTIYGLTYNKAGSRIATVDYSGKLFIWNASNGQMLHHRQLPASAAYSVSYTPDGTEVIVGTSDPRVFRVLVPPPVR